MPYKVYLLLYVFPPPLNNPYPPNSTLTSVFLSILTITTAHLTNCDLWYYYLRDMRKVTVRQIRREFGVLWLRDYAPCVVTYHGHPIAQVIALDSQASLDNAPVVDNNEGKETAKITAEILKPKDYLEELYG